MMQFVPKFVITVRVGVNCNCNWNFGVDRNCNWECYTNVIVIVIDFWGTVIDQLHSITF